MVQMPHGIERAKAGGEMKTTSDAVEMRAVAGYEVVVPIVKAEGAG
jgi:hypothetical protein